MPKNENLDFTQAQLHKDESISQMPRNGAPTDYLSYFDNAQKLMHDKKKEMYEFQVKAIEKDKQYFLKVSNTDIYGTAPSINQLEEVKPLVLKKETNFAITQM